MALAALRAALAGRRGIATAATASATGDLRWAAPPPALRQHRFLRPTEQAAFQVFAANTGTGKTVLAAGLVQAGLRAGRQVLYLKPIQTGYPEDSDSRYCMHTGRERQRHSRPAEPTPGMGVGGIAIGLYRVMRRPRRWRPWSPTAKLSARTLPPSWCDSCRPGEGGTLAANDDAKANSCVYGTPIGAARRPGLCRAATGGRSHGCL